MMNRKTNSNNNGRMTSGQRSGIRLALATGATLAMLISAQLFASGSAATTATTQNTSQVAAVATSVQIATATPTTATVQDEIVTNTTSTSSIFTTQSQPVPSTHSSK